MSLNWDDADEEMDGDKPITGEGVGGGKEGKGPKVLEREPGYPDSDVTVLGFARELAETEKIPAGEIWSVGTLLGLLGGGLALGLGIYFNILGAIVIGIIAVLLAGARVGLHYVSRDRKKPVAKAATAMDIKKKGVPLGLKRIKDLFEAPGELHGSEEEKARWNKEWKELLPLYVDEPPPPTLATPLADPEDAERYKPLLAKLPRATAEYKRRYEEETSKGATVTSSALDLFGAVVSAKAIWTVAFIALLAFLWANRAWFVNEGERFRQSVAPVTDPQSPYVPSLGATDNQSSDAAYGLSPTGDIRTVDDQSDYDPNARFGKPGSASVKDPEVELK